MLTGANDLDTIMTKLGIARQAVFSLEDTRDLQVVSLTQDHEHLCSTVTVVSKSSPAAVVAWGGKVASRAVTLPSTDAPLGVAAKNTAISTTVDVSCKADRRAAVYLVQQGADATHPETWPPPVLSPRSRYAVTGLTVGQKVCFRMAMLRHNGGMSLWSDVVTVTVR